MSTDLNTFANQWIREGMTATSIEGFGPGTPPPPPLDFEDVDRGTLVPREPEPEPEPTPVSPLLALGKAPPREPEPLPSVRPTIRAAHDPSIVGLAISEHSLLVMGESGRYKGQNVTLSKADQAAIGRIILECAHRKLREQLAEVSKAAPRRIRKPAPEPAPAPVAVAPKPRRGRPPKPKAQA